MKPNEDAENIKKQWRALGREMDLLTLRDLRDEQWDIIFAARKNPRACEVSAQLPLTVARFKKKARQDIYRRAKNIDPYQIATDLAQRFHTDADKINRFLFGSSLDIDQAHALLGRFRAARTPHIHADVGSHAPVYAARLNALPLWYVRDQARWEADQETARLLATARRIDDPNRDKARRNLVGRKILVPLALGDVALMRAGYFPDDPLGTWHCSSPVSPRGRISALFHTKGYAWVSYPVRQR